MSQAEDQLDSGGGITDLISTPSTKKDSLGGSVIRDYLDQKGYILHKFQ